MDAKQVQQLLQNAQKLNEQVVKHNEQSKKFEGYREATLKQINTMVDEYNAEYGTSITLDDMKTLQDEYTKEVQVIYNNSKQLTEVLNAIQSNDMRKVKELTGVDVTQDTLTVPNLNIDFDEMEKQAELTYSKAKTELDDINMFGSTTEESIEDLDSSSFQGVDEGVEEPESEDVGVVEEEKASETPDFSSMFNAVKVEDGDDEKEDEEGDINNFLTNFGESESSKKDADVDKAVQNQPEPPLFDFGSIDID